MVECQHPIVPGSHTALVCDGQYGGALGILRATEANIELGIRCPIIERYWTG